MRGSVGENWQSREPRLAGRENSSRTCGSVRSLAHDSLVSGFNRMHAEAPIAFTLERVLNADYIPTFIGSLQRTTIRSNDLRRKLVDNSA